MVTHRKIPYEEFVYQNSIKYKKFVKYVGPQNAFITTGRVYPVNDENKFMDDCDVFVWSIDNNPENFETSNREEYLNCYKDKIIYYPLSNIMK